MRRFRVRASHHTAHQAVIPLGDGPARGTAALLAGPGPVAVVVGATGGAGATTIARLLGARAEDHGRQVPPPDDRPLVIATRSTAAGLAAATRLLTEALRVGHVRPAVVVVADAPLPAPPQARARLRLLRDPQRTRAVVELPYVLGWRDVDDPTAVGTPVPPSVRAALERLASALAPVTPAASPAAPSGAAVRTA